ncbi:unnamed protein product [Phaeothamnion confervicola]
MSEGSESWDESPTPRRKAPKAAKRTSRDTNAAAPAASGESSAGSPPRGDADDGDGEDASGGGGGGGGGARRASARPQLEQLEKLYHWPLRKVADDMKISVAKLLKVCRKFCILRWPYRQVRSLRDAIHELQRDIASAAAAGQGAAAQQLLQRRLHLAMRKEELVVCYASRGLEAPVREKFFTWDAAEVEKSLMRIVHGLESNGDGFGTGGSGGGGGGAGDADVVVTAARWRRQPAGKQRNGGGASDDDGGGDGGGGSSRGGGAGAAAAGVAVTPGALRLLKGTGKHYRKLSAIFTPNELDRVLGGLLSALADVQYSSCKKRAAGEGLPFAVLSGSAAAVAAAAAAANASVRPKRKRALSTASDAFSLDGDASSSGGDDGSHGGGIARTRGRRHGAAASGGAAPHDWREEGTYGGGGGGSKDGSADGRSWHGSEAGVAGETPGAEAAGGGDGGGGWDASRKGPGDSFADAQEHHRRPNHFGPPHDAAPGTGVYYPPQHHPMARTVQGGGGAPAVPPLVGAGSQSQDRDEDERTAALAMAMAATQAPAHRAAAPPDGAGRRSPHPPMHPSGSGGGGTTRRSGDSGCNGGGGGGGDWMGKHERRPHWGNEPQLGGGPVRQQNPWYRDAGGAVAGEGQFSASYSFGTPWQRRLAETLGAGAGGGCGGGSGTIAAAGARSIEAEFQRIYGGSGVGGGGPAPLPPQPGRISRGGSSDPPMDQGRSTVKGDGGGRAAALAEAGSSSPFPEKRVDSSVLAAAALLCMRPLSAVEPRSDGGGNGGSARNSAGRDGVGSKDGGEGELPALPLLAHMAPSPSRGGGGRGGSYDNGDGSYDIGGGRYGGESDIGGYSGSYGGRDGSYGNGSGAAARLRPKPYEGLGVAVAMEHTADPRQGGSSGGGRGGSGKGEGGEGAAAGGGGGGDGYGSKAGGEEAPFRLPSVASLLARVVGKIGPAAGGAVNGYHASNGGPMGTSPPDGGGGRCGGGVGDNDNGGAGEWQQVGIGWQMPAPPPPQTRRGGPWDEWPR